MLMPCSTTPRGSAKAAALTETPSGSTRTMSRPTSMYWAIAPWVCGQVDALPR